MRTWPYLLGAYFVFGCIAWGFLVSRKHSQLRNWDMVMYIGVAISADEPDVAKVQQLTYDTLRHTVGEEQMHWFIYDDYTTSVATDPAFFEQELLKYSTKPFYTTTVRWLHGLGARFDYASSLPSSVSAVILCALMLGWLWKPRGALVGLGVAVVLLFSHAMLRYATFSTPDLATAPWVMLALMAIYFRWHPAWMVAFMAIAAGFRTDHLIYLGLIFVYAAYELFERRGVPTGRRLGYTLGVAAGGVVLTAIGLLAIGGDVRRLWDAYAHVYEWQGYTERFWYSTDEWMHNSMAPLLTAVAIGCFGLLNAGGRRLVAVAGALVVIRLLLVPVFEERFFLGFEWAVLGACIAGISRLPLPGTLRDRPAIVR